MCRAAGAVGAGSSRRTHHRHADLAHDGADVGKVDVDEPRIVDDLRDARHRAVQHIVRRRVRIEHRDVLAQHIHQFFVRNDDERIDFLRQLLDACTRDALPLPFELEGPGYDCDSENAETLRNVGDHGLQDRIALFGR